jgi:hypothetical protein
MPSRTQTCMIRLHDRLYLKDLAHSQHERPLHLCYGLSSHCITLVAHLDCNMRPQYACSPSQSFPSARKASFRGAKVRDRSPASLVTSDLRECVRRTLKLKQQMAWVAILLSLLDGQEDSAGRPGQQQVETIITGTRGKGGQS